MKKKLTLILIVMLCFSFSSFSLLKEDKNKTTKMESIAVNDAPYAITLRYYNKDSKDYEFRVKTCGSTKTVKFGKSKTASVTIQTGCSDAIIFDKCGEVKVEKGDKITIKDGCIKVD